MDDAISRRAAIEAMSCISDSICGQQAVDALCELPSAERHGKWLHKNGKFKNRWLCSVCGYTWYFDTAEANYCPYCGSKNGR